MRLIDADELKRSFNKLCDRFGEDFHISAIETEIDAAQTVDAVEVVRCKDCKHYKEFRTKRNKQIMRLCCRMGKNDMEYSVKPDDFCSYGELKEGVDND